MDIALVIAVQGLFVILAIILIRKALVSFRIRFDQRAVSPQILEDAYSITMLLASAGDCQNERQRASIMEKALNQAVQLRQEVLVEETLYPEQHD